MISVDAERWFAFRLRPRQEHLGEFNLARQGFKTFIPRIRVARQRKNGVESTKELLFPRYGFVSMDLGYHRWRSVNGTYGVESLVMSIDRPLAVPTGVVEQLLARVDSEGLVRLGDEIAPGSTVRVVGGPFGGLIATLLTRDAKGRVELLVQLLNSSARVRGENLSLVMVDTHA